MALQHFSYPPCQNIKIAEVNIAYRNEVARYLDLIGTTFSGRRLFEFIAMKPDKLVIIQPVRPGGPINDAGATPANEADGYDANDVVMSPVTLFGKKIMVATLVRGTGAGTDVIVEYHPATWRERAKRRGVIDPGAGPGEVLFHELVHSMRDVHGKTLRHNVWENLDMNDFEEFCAVAASNIYRQERGFKALRANHNGFTALRGETTYSEKTRAPNGATVVTTVTIDGDPLTNPTNYYNFYKNEFKKWFDSQIDFCKAMARSTVAFNPFAVAAKDLRIPS
jgi:hypothetical protein